MAIRSPIIEKLLAASAEGKTLLEVPEVNDLDLSPEDQNAIRAIVLSNPDYRSYHLLFALKNTKKPLVTIPDDVKADILCSALEHVVYYNDWSLLDPVESNERQAGQEILSAGMYSVACLKRLLGHTRSAPFFGSEDAAMSSTYQYRINDFAFRYISLILKREAPFLPESEARDMLIQQLNDDPSLKKF